MAAIRRDPTTEPTRDFTLNVNPLIFHAAPSPDKTIISYQVGRNVYFYMSKSYKLAETKEAHQKIVNMMSAHIIQLVNKEAQRLLKYWYDNVNLYFNRRAYGVRYNRGRYRARGPQRGKVSTPYIANSRQHTGQLRRSLTIRSISVYGAELYARRVHAKTNNADYIEILMNGAMAHQGAYTPILDLRVKRGVWRGISPQYWRNWQVAFQKQIHLAEARVNADIEKYVTKMGILTPKELKAIRNVRHNKEFITEVIKNERNFSIEFKKPKYQGNRGLDPYDEPWDERQTWEGMKKAYYAKQIENPYNILLQQPSQLNTVIIRNASRRRRNSGRSH